MVGTVLRMWQENVSLQEARSLEAVSTTGKVFETLAKICEDPFTQILPPCKMSIVFCHFSGFSGYLFNSALHFANFDRWPNIS
jgi:hypothetical protein